MRAGVARWIRLTAGVITAVMVTTIVMTAVVVAIIAIAVERIAAACRRRNAPEQSLWYSG